MQLVGAQAELKKIIFVLRFIRLKRAMYFDDNNPGYKKWVTKILKDVANDGADADDGDDFLGPQPDDDDVND